MNMLQAIVTRLAGSSASCKTWCTGLVTALLGLAGSLHAPQLLVLALVPTAIYAFLDASYLSQERWFRSRFEALAAQARGGRYACGDLFAMGARSRGQAARDLLRAFGSWSIWSVYGGLIVAYLWARQAGFLELLGTSSGK